MKSQPKFRPNSDLKLMDQVRENPYLQYFVGLSTFQTEAPFAPSLFVDIRWRMGEQVFESFNQSIIDATVAEQAIRFPTDLGLLNEARRRKAEYRERIPIEGKFGQGKNGYRLNYIRARTQATSEAWIRSIFLVMNRLVLTRSFLRRLKMELCYSYSVIKELFIKFDQLIGAISAPATAIIPDCPV